MLKIFTSKATQSKRPIGVFDSGSGGLTVVKRLHEVLPHEDIIYVGDLQRMPYGPRRPQEIIHFMNEFLGFFAKEDVKMVVFACNTMTSWGYNLIKDQVPYLAVPMNTALKPALAAAPHKKIGLIATEATIKKEFHHEAAKRLDPSIELYARACPAFVSLIESGHIDDEVLLTAVREYLSPLQKKGIESLILGCTHYPIIEAALKSQLGSSVQLIDPARETALDAKHILQKNGLLNEEDGQGKLRFLFSAAQEHAQQMVKLILGIEATIEAIDLEEYNDCCYQK